MDFSGQRPHLVDPTTIALIVVELFVGVLGASALIYAEATPSQDLPSRVGAHVRMLDAFPRLSACHQVQIDAEAARTGLVDEVELPIRRTQRAHDLVQRLKIARDDPVMADFSITLLLSDRSVDRVFVDIQPYEHVNGSP